MNKSQLIQKFIVVIEDQLNLAIQAQKTTVDYATHEDNKAENQYDTRGLEATYLARGQAERVADLRESLIYFRTAQLKTYNENTSIGNTALVEITNINTPHDSKTLLMMPKGGGLTVDMNGKNIQVVTASSPLGQALVDKYTGDEVTYHSAQKRYEYEIMSVS